MTCRERRRQRLMWAVEHWMRRHGLCAVLLFTLCLTTAAFAEEKTKKPAQPVSLMKILSDKDLVTALTPKAAKQGTKKTDPVAVKPAAVKSNDEKSVEKSEDKDERFVEKTVSGTVVFIRKDKMSVEFASSDEEGGQEMLLGLDPKVQLQNAKDVSKIKFGDQVQVKYTEAYRESKEKGQPPVVLSRTGTEIKFLKAAPKVQAVGPDAMMSKEGF